jgi:hypothetical protein
VIRIIYVEHCSGSVPFFYVGAENDGLRTIPPLVTITGNSLDEVVFHDYISGLKVLECRALFASERCSASLDDQRLPEES